MESDELQTLLPRSARFVGIVTDMSVDTLYARKLAARLRIEGKREVAVYVLPDGEPSKGRQWKELIEEWLFGCKADKASCLLALGGGVVGDLTGFVAATYLRGIPFLQVPTSLLAMVDSSIGGKTAIDVAAGKNLIGCFNHPAAVAIDTSFLETLPLRQLCNGMAEVIKVAAALDAAFFEWLERPDVSKLICEARDKETLLHCVQRSAALKARIVDEDERDGGRRNILNLGHTIGHALEACLAPKWLHGECVAVGVIVEAYAALDAGVLSSTATIERIRRVLKLYRLPFAVPFDEISTRMDEMLSFALMDKKAANAKIRCVFLSGVGCVGEKITYSMDQDLFRQLLSQGISVVPGSSGSSGAVGATSVCVPGSKSVSNRVLLLAGLSAGVTIVSGLLHAADTYVSLEALSVLGVKWTWNTAGSELRIEGSGGKLNVSPDAHIFLDNAGTASRFLTACVTWLPVGQQVTLRGSARMHERPIRPLVDALRSIGVKIDYLGKEGHFPLFVHGNDGLPRGARISLDSSVSSQFTSAVLLAGCKGGVELHLTGTLISQPYVRMTIALMRQFGVQVQSSADFTVHSIPNAGYVNPPNTAVEADASSATYPLAFAALTNRQVTVTNIGFDSMQGDAKFAFLLEKMGCRIEQTAGTTTVTGPTYRSQLVCIPEVDMADQTDAFLTMAVLAACAHGTCRIVGIANQRVKECNRIAAVVSGLQSCGVVAKELEDGIEVTGGVTPSSERHLIHCFNDHRVAMSFAILGCVVPNVVLLDKACVDKTFPNFWHMLKRAFNISVMAAPERDTPHAAAEVTTPTGPSRIVLIGMRGAGKTTHGERLARALGMWFVDADAKFMETSGKPPKQFVAEHGMAEFRSQEAAILRKLLAQKNCVIACGGGIVETPEARALLQGARSSTLIVHVRRDWNSLASYLTDESNRVPLAEPLEATWERRLPHYEALADVEYFWSDSISSPGIDMFVERYFAQRFWPAWRIGPGTMFESLNAHTYRDLEGGPCAADAVEFRVDELKDVSQESVRIELARIRGVLRPGIPVVFTVRSVGQGGKWSGTAEEYFKLLRTGIASGCEVIDIESCWQVPDVINYAKCRFIFSDHRMSTRPSLALLKDMALGCRRIAPDVPAVIKLVCLGAEPSDCDVMQDFARGPFQHICHPDAAGFILLLVGAAGRLSRIRNALLTPCASHLSAVAAAPGQFFAEQLKSARKEVGLTAKGKLFLFGKPISKSLSPAIHNSAFEHFDLPLEYSLCETDSVDTLRTTFALADFVGGNVTIPLKEEALKCVDFASDSARRIGAVNTVWKTEGRLYGDNTDWRGMVELFKPHLPLTVAVVIGSGGTARAAVYAAQQCGAANVFIWNRTHAKAQQLQRHFGSQCKAVESLAAVADVDLVISCVPGASEGLVIPAGWRPKCMLDCAYVPRVTNVMRQMPEACVVMDGFRLLLEQGIWGSRIWTAREPPRKVMENAMK